MKTPAEARLTLAYSAAVLTPVSLFLFAFTAPYTSIHWAVPCFAEMLFGVSIMCIFTAYIPYLVDSYRESSCDFCGPSELISGTSSLDRRLGVGSRARKSVPGGLRVPAILLADVS